MTCETRPPSVDVDCTDLTCVQLLRRLSHHITDLAPGSIVTVRANDPAAPLDLAAWCHLTGHPYLGPTNNGYDLRLEPHARATHHQSPWRHQTP